MYNMLLNTVQIIIKVRKVKFEKNVSEKKNIFGRYILSIPDSNIIEFIFVCRKEYLRLSIKYLLVR